MSAGIDAVLVPAQARQEFNQAMVDFHVSRDGTTVMDLFGSCGPRHDQTMQRRLRVNREARPAGSEGLQA